MGWRIHHSSLFAAFILVGDSNRMTPLRYLLGALFTRTEPDGRTISLLALSMPITRPGVIALGDRKLAT